MYLYRFLVGGRGRGGARGYYNNSSQAATQNGADHDSAVQPSDIQQLNRVTPAAVNGAAPSEGQPSFHL